jgi:hypothetical protein
MSHRKEKRRSGSEGTRISEHRSKLAPGVANAGGWGECECCGQYLPIVAEVGMCGPCTFGEADAMFEI